jgi:hypothetical protein
VGTRVTQGIKSPYPQKLIVRGKEDGDKEYIYKGDGYPPMIHKVKLNSTSLSSNLSGSLFPNTYYILYI